MLLDKWAVLFPLVNLPLIAGAYRGCCGEAKWNDKENDYEGGKVTMLPLSEFPQPLLNKTPWNRLYALKCLSSLVRCHQPNGWKEWNFPSPLVTSTYTWCAVTSGRRDRQWITTTVFRPLHNLDLLLSSCFHFVPSRPLGCLVFTAI